MGAMNAEPVIHAEDGTPRTASLRVMEALLVEACRIADAVGLDLAGIRIEEALSITRNQAGAPDHDGLSTRSTTLN